MLITMTNTRMPSAPLEGEGGTYCACLQVTELDHRGCITERQDLVG